MLAPGREPDALELSVPPAALHLLEHRGERVEQSEIVRAVVNGEARARGEPRVTHEHGFESVTWARAGARGFGEKALQLGQVHGCCSIADESQAPATPRARAASASSSFNAGTRSSHSM